MVTNFGHEHILGSAHYQNQESGIKNLNRWSQRQGGLGHENFVFSSNNELDLRNEHAVADFSGREA